MLPRSSREGKLKGKLKNQQWLKKHGILSQGFGNAKAQGSYNPHLIKKQRELYRNAKLIKKFKKSVKQQNPENSALKVPVTEMDDTEIELDGEDQRKQILPVDKESRGLHEDVQQEQIQLDDQKRRKKNKTLQCVREEYERRRAEEEKAKMEREAIAKARQEEKERAMAKRKELRGHMFKKTRSGQPVMKFRIQHMLDGITGNPDK